MNVLDLLKQDHQTVDALFSTMLSTSSADKAHREELFKTLKTELVRHAHAEEKVFYAPLRDKQEAHDVIEEGIGEHHHVEELLQKMEAVPADSDDWLDQLQGVRQCVQHHVEEEEGEIFDDARKLLSAQTLEGMTEKMREAKRNEQI